MTTETETCEVCSRPVSEHSDGLKCCPFCGGEVGVSMGMGEYWVHCPCDATSAHGGPEMTRAQWNKRAVPPWISVEERPCPQDGPFLALFSDEDDGQVLVAESGAGVHLPFETWRNYEDDENEDYATKMMDQITHWMPLPAPPSARTILHITWNIWRARMMPTDDYTIQDAMSEHPEAVKAVMEEDGWTENGGKWYNRDQWDAFWSSRSVWTGTLIPVTTATDDTLIAACVRWLDASPPNDRETWEDIMTQWGDTSILERLLMAVEECMEDDD